MEPREAVFARLFEAVHEGVYIGTIGPDSTSTIAANPHLKLIFGYASEALDADVRPFDRECFVDPQARAALVARLSADGAVNDYLLRLRRADTSAVWVELTAAAEGPLEDGSVRVEALVRDVSERKKLDDETRDIYHQLLQAEKMAALGQTISGVAHELNNPLAPILSWAERLSSRATLEEPVRQGLETILTESERAARIVRNLLTFARKRQTTRAMVDINQIIRETLALRAYDQRVSNITVIDALAAGLPQVFADGHQMQQVLLNLIINAEQAIREIRDHGTLRIRVARLGENVVATFQDDGVGIRRDILAKIFDPFFTTKRPGRGTGLGLSICLAILREHNSHIEAQPLSDGGSVFTLSMPIAKGNDLALASPVVSRAAPAPSASLAGCSLLVVDDEESIREMLRDGLTSRGARVELAATGEEALCMMESRSYDVVLCDLNLNTSAPAAISGQELFARATRLAAGIPQGRATRLGADIPAERGPVFVLMTGELAEQTEILDSEHSKVRTLQKPFRIADVAKLISEVLGQAQQAGTQVIKTG